MSWGLSPWGWCQMSSLRMEQTLQESGEYEDGFWGVQLLCHAWSLRLEWVKVEHEVLLVPVLMQGSETRKKKGL